MTDTESAVADLLREVADLHHRVYRLTDGADDDWASFYSDWLVNHSELPQLLGRPLVRSELTALLVDAAKNQGSGEDWVTAYAAAIIGYAG